MVTLPADVLARYRRFSLYNSPYVAHDAGRAIDLYPGGERAPSPVAGEVLDVRTVRAPPKPYASDHDHLIVIDTGPGDAGRREESRYAVDGEPAIARVMHVDPAVDPGERVRVGDDLGELVRAGFFAPWVDNHLHVGFRARGVDPYRASGSVQIDVEPTVRPLPWDGTGIVAETGDTYALLDSPEHPAPGERFAGIADGGVETALDGGLPHYDGGGALAGASGTVRLLGAPVGTAAGRDVEWDDPQVVANGRPITGLSLFAARDAGFGAKLICPEASFEVGERIRVRIEPGTGPDRES